MDLIYHVTSSDAGHKVSSILRSQLQFSRSEIRKLKRLAGVRVNWQTVWLNHLVGAGDVIMVSLKDEGEQPVLPQDMPLKIQFEDEHLLLVDKPAGMLVHPLAPLHLQGTLANGVIHHFRQQGLNAKFRAASRLDKDTTGLILIAKSSYVCQQLADQMKTGLCRRKYLAVVHNPLKIHSGVINQPIGRPYEDSLIFGVTATGKDAVTAFSLVEQLKNGSVVSLQLETGRTHQIRVHMKHIGHPLMGDDLYEGSTELIKRQALHSQILEFTHPVTGARMRFETPLPPDMASLIEVLRAGP